LCNDGRPANAYPNDGLTPLLLADYLARLRQIHALYLAATERLLVAVEPAIWPLVHGEVAGYTALSHHSLQPCEATQLAAELQVERARLQQLGDAIDELDCLLRPDAGAASQGG
jgi:hypothetical protein